MALIDDIQCVHDVMVAVATGTRYDEDREMISSFKRSRNALVQNESIKSLLPNFVTRYRDLASFWGFIKNKVVVTLNGDSTSQKNSLNFLHLQNAAIILLSIVSLQE